MDTDHSHVCFQKYCPLHEQGHRDLRHAIDAQFEPMQVMLLEQGKINLATDIQEALRRPIVDAVCHHLSQDSALDRESVQGEVLKRADRELRRILRTLFPGHRRLLASIKHFVGIRTKRFRGEKGPNCNCAP